MCVKYRPDDPAFPAYWSHRQSEVRSMCSQFGDPDLMLTFTFVNKWNEVKEAERSIKALNYDDVDIRFCPLEEMYIWHNRFYDIKANGFNDLIKSMGFGNVLHFTWRLEFQARGAPHVHALIWLSSRLSLNHIEKCLFATMPCGETPKLKELVEGPMVHTCNLNRCKKGIPNSRCKYGFPKQECSSIRVSDEGELFLPRTHDDANIVEYSPFFLLKWEGIVTYMY